MAVATMTNEAGSSELTRPIQELIASGKLRALQNDLLEGLKDDEDKGHGLTFTKSAKSIPLGLSVAT